MMQLLLMVMIVVPYETCVALVVLDTLRALDVGSVGGDGAYGAQAHLAAEERHLVARVLQAAGVVWRIPPELPTAHVRSARRAQAVETEAARSIARRPEHTNLNIETKRMEDGEMRQERQCNCSVVDAAYCLHTI